MFLAYVFTYLGLGLRPGFLCGVREGINKSVYVWMPHAPRGALSPKSYGPHMR